MNKDRIEWEFAAYERRRKTRNERKRDFVWKLALTSILLAWAMFLVGFFIAGAFEDVSEGNYTPQQENAAEGLKTAFVADDDHIPGDDIPATERCYMTEAEVQEDFENEKIEAAILANATRLDGVTVSHYCSERYPHICGTGDGITASGLMVTPYVSIAVDPDVIPLGSDVLVDYGDGVFHYYRADDVGAAVDGFHIDVAVTTHDEALALGIKKATVYWCKEGLR